MNIRGLVNIPVPEIRATPSVDRSIRSDSSHERDANGQQTYQEQKREKRESMNEEEIQRSLEHLRSLGAVKEHKWTVELAEEQGSKFVLVKDNLGNVIRKIPEYELWTLPIDHDDKKGQLLKKSA